jgi:putative peptidoglycan lipid II flippase
MDRKTKITKAAGVMSIATFISRVLGYIKDMILAAYFGASGLSDAFFAAFRIPNLLRELFAEGSMSSAFIPVLTEYREKKSEEEARRLVRITFTFILVVVGLICVLGIIFAPAVVSVMAPGFLTKHPEQFPITVFLTRIMFPFLLFISLASLVMGSLNTRKIFFVPALAPAMLNVTIIFIVIFFAPRVSSPIALVALAVTLGGFVQFAFQLPSFYRNQYSLGFDPNFRHPGLKKMAILLLPATMGLAVGQLNILISSILASFLTKGSITMLYYAMRLIQFPVGIFGVAMGMAILPTLSEHAVRGDMQRLREDFSFALRLLFFITVPSMAGLIALREPIVNLLFQRGEFDYVAMKGTADALLFYALGIWSMVGVRVVTVTFYSMQDTRTPVKIAIIGMLSNIILGILLMGPMKHSGLAFANALASGLNFSLLFYFLREKVQHVDSRRIAASFFKTGVSSILMGISGWAVIQGELWQMSGNTAIKAAYLSGTIFLCLIIYMGCSYLLKNEEMAYIFNIMKKKFSK